MDSIVVTRKGGRLRVALPDGAARDMGEFGEADIAWVEGSDKLVVVRWAAAGPSLSIHDLYGDGQVQIEIAPNRELIDSGSFVTFVDGIINVQLVIVEEGSPDKLAVRSYVAATGEFISEQVHPYEDTIWVQRVPTRGSRTKVAMQSD